MLKIFLEDSIYHKNAAKSCKIIASNISNFFSFFDEPADISLNVNSSNIQLYIRIIFASWYFCIVSVEFFNFLVTLVYTYQNICLELQVIAFLDSHTGSLRKYIRT